MTEFIYDVTNQIKTLRVDTIRTCTIQDWKITNPQFTLWIQAIFLLYYYQWKEKSIVWFKSNQALRVGTHVKIQVWKWHRHRRCKETAFRKIVIVALPPRGGGGWAFTAIYMYWLCRYVPLWRLQFLSILLFTLEITWRLN